MLKFKTATRKRFFLLLPRGRPTQRNGFDVLHFPLCAARRLHVAICNLDTLSNVVVMHALQNTMQCERAYVDLFIVNVSVFLPNARANDFAYPQHIQININVTLADLFQNSTPLHLVVYQYKVNISCIIVKFLTNSVEWLY